MEVYHSKGEANGKPFDRYEFDSFEALEKYFLANFWGRPGIRSKVIGMVLLVQEREQEQ